MLHYVNLGETMHLQLGTIDNDTKRWLKSYMRHLKYKDVSKNTLDVYTRILSSTFRIH